MEGAYHQGEAEFERNEASSECLGESGVADEERKDGRGSASMARTGCTVQETERGLGTCSHADEELQDGWILRSMEHAGQRNEESSECRGESGDTDEE